MISAPTIRTKNLFAKFHVIFPLSAPETIMSRRSSFRRKLLFCTRQSTSRKQYRALALNHNSTNTTKREKPKNRRFAVGVILKRAAISPLKARPAGHKIQSKMRSIFYPIPLHIQVESKTKQAIPYYIKTKTQKHIKRRLPS